MTPHRFFLATLVAMLFFVTAGCTVNYTEPPRAVYDDPAPPPPPPPDQEFYELNEHGEWIDIYPHGLVWRPYVTTDWRPYIYGHWVWSEWGWTWVSYEPFGWAVYHYGYWRYSPAWGWIWIPGYDWAPVLVQWVWFEDYVCWAPAPPPGYHLPDPWLTHSADVWVVVHARHFTHYDLHRFRVGPPSYKDHYRSGDTITREPPRLIEIERHTRKEIPRVELKVKEYTSGKRTYKRVVLPESERKVVDRYQPHVKKRAADPEMEQRATTEKQPLEREKKQKTDKTKETKPPKSRSKSKSKKSG